MRFDFDGPLVLAGAGKMGGALLEGLLARGLDPARVRVQDPSPPAEVAAHLASHGIQRRARDRQARSAGRRSAGRREAATHGQRCFPRWRVWLALKRW